MKGLRNLAAMLIVGALAVIGTLAVMKHVQVPYTASSRVLITAAHLDDIAGYTRVFTDEDNDYSVFVQDDYRATRLPSGVEVTYLNSRGVIEECSATMFFVRPSNINAIVPGVSGSPVYYRDIPIGFISGWDGSGRVRCIFY